MKVLAYLNLHMAPGLGPLTKSRSSATVSFLGRYAFMDFMLSNFSNSGIDQTAILVDAHPHSVLKHLGSRNTYNVNTKIGFEIVAYNEGGNRLGPRYNTDIANIIHNDWVLKQSNPDYVVFAPGYIVAPLDLRPALKVHAKSGNDITLIYQKVNNAKGHFISRPVLSIDENNLVTSYTRNKGEKEERNIGLEVAIISRAKFGELLDKAIKTSPFYTLSDVIAQEISEGVPVNAFEYVGYLRVIDSYAHYFEYSFELLHYPLRKQLFLREWPIYTVTHDTPPAKYEESANVSNSFIANGAQIAGTVRNSIISRNVRIRKDAFVEDCIIFTDSIIHPGRVLKHAVLDKNVEVKYVEHLEGVWNDKLYIRKGDTV